MWPISWAHVCPTASQILLSLRKAAGHCITGGKRPVKNESSPEDSAAAHAAGGVLPPAGGLMKGVDDAPADASARQARLF